HIPLASLSADAAANTVTFLAPSKTFNVAGLYTSLIIAADDNLRQKVKALLTALDVPSGNVFGLTAAEAAYTHGDGWLDRQLDYLSANADFLCRQINDHTPITVRRPEATFLAWLDCRAMVGKIGDPSRFFLNTAGVALSTGSVFGDEGRDFMRMNFGCPRATLADGLTRIIDACRAL
ncbi:MAG: cystathionine beta-lyase, partial [Negativicutes bacterium]|nr:cystathionine beta-lyase [Negativicutes bacterium]